MKRLGIALFVCVALVGGCALAGCSSRTLADTSSTSTILAAVTSVPISSTTTTTIAPSTTASAPTTTATSALETTSTLEQTTTTAKPTTTTLSEAALRSSFVAFVKNQARNHSDHYIPAGAALKIRVLQGPTHDSHGVWWAYGYANDSADHEWGVIGKSSGGTWKLVASDAYELIETYGNRIPTAVFKKWFGHVWYES